MKDNIIVNSICEYIKEKILSKEMFPGYRIVEDELSNELGVSRTPLRRALAQLQYEGFLYIVPNRGTFVVQSSYEDILQVYKARTCIETGMGEEIMSNITDQDIEDLESIQEKMREIVENGMMMEYSLVNRQFHERLAAITGNDYLCKYTAEIYNRISMFLVYYNESLDNAESLVTHAAIIDSLKKKNIEEYVVAVKNDMELGNLATIRGNRKTAQVRPTFGWQVND